MQCKDIPESVIIDAIRATRGRHGVPKWATTWDVAEHLSRYPKKLVVAKLKGMCDRGVIGGHVCSVDEPWCRGDFELIERDNDA